MTHYRIAFAEPNHSGPIAIEGPTGVVATFPHRGCGGSARFDAALENAQVCLAALERPAYRDGSLLRAVLLGDSADNLSLTPLSWLHTMTSACEKPSVPERLGIDDPESWSEMCAEVRRLVTAAKRSLGISAALDVIAEARGGGTAPTEPELLERCAQAVLGPSAAEIDGDTLTLDQARAERWDSVAEAHRETARAIARDAILRASAA